MYNDKVAKLILITILAAAVTFTVLTWSLMQPPTNTAQIKFGTPTPQDVYPVSFKGYKITVILGFFDYSDLWIAEKGGSQMQSDTLYGLIQQIGSTSP